MMSTESEPMPPEARKLAQLAVATVIACRVLNREDIVSATGDANAGALGQYTDFVAAVASSLADKLLANSRL